MVKACAGSSTPDTTISVSLQSFPKIDMVVFPGRGGRSVGSNVARLMMLVVVIDRVQKATKSSRQARQQKVKVEVKFEMARTNTAFS